MAPRITIDTNNVLTIGAAAKLLKISRQAAFLAVKNKRLESIEIAGVTFVIKQSVQQYRKTRRPGGPKSQRQ